MSLDEERRVIFLSRMNGLSTRLLSIDDELETYLTNPQRMHTEGISYRRYLDDVNILGRKVINVAASLALGFAIDSINLFFKLMVLAPYLLTLVEIATMIWLTKELVVVLDDVVLIFLNGIESSINPFIDFLNKYIVDILRDVLNDLCSFCICIRIGPIHIAAHVFRFLCPHFSNIPTVNLSSSGRWATILNVLSELKCGGNFVVVGFEEIMFTVRLHTSTSICRLFATLDNVPIIRDIFKFLLGWLTFGGEKCDAPDDVVEWICYVLNSYTVIYLAILIYLVVLSIDEYWPRFLGPIWDFIRTLTYKIARMIRGDVQNLVRRRYDP